jgi:hypothetical protein
MLITLTSERYLTIAAKAAAIIVLTTIAVRADAAIEAAVKERLSNHPSDSRSHSDRGEAHASRRVPAWVGARHPPRSATGVIDVSQDKGGISSNAEYRLFLRSSDPLVRTIQRNGYSGLNKDLVEYVIGAPIDPDTFDDNVTVSQRPGAGVVEVALDTFPRVSDGASAPDSNGPVQHLIIGIDTRPPENNLEALVTSRDVTVKFAGLSYEKVRGPAETYAETDETIRFVGRPTAQELSLETSYYLPPAPYFGLTVSQVVFVLAVLAPWIVLLVTSHRSRHHLRTRLVSFSILVLLAVPAMGAVLTFRTDLLVVPGLLMLVLPSTITASVRATAGRRPLGPRDLFASGLLTSVVVVIEVYELLPMDLSSAIALVRQLVVVVTCSIVVGALLGGRRWAPTVALLGASTAPAVLVPHLVPGYASTLLLGISFLPMLMSLSRLAGLNWRWVILLAGLCPLLFVGIARLLVEPREPSLWLLGVSSVDLGVAWVVAVNILLAAGSLWILRSLGAVGGRCAKPLDHLQVRCAVALTLVTVYTPPPVRGSSLLEELLAALALWWLLSSPDVTRGIRLLQVTVPVHRRLVRIEERRRLLAAGLQHLNQMAKSRLATGELSVGELDRLVGDLDMSSVSPAGSRATEYITAREAALGSAAGYSPWQNCVTSARLAALLAGPVMIYEGVALILSSRRSDNLDYLYGISYIDFLRHVLRWVAYGVFFGYLYPALRGRRPITKSFYLLPAILLPQLVEVGLAGNTRSTVLFAACILLGQTVFFCAALGLLWERRLVLAAGMEWGRLRDSRSIGSLAVPATTVIVAAATAVAVAFANAAVSSLLHPQVPAAPANSQRGTAPNGSKP